MLQKVLFKLIIVLLILACEAVFSAFSEKWGSLLPLVVGNFLVFIVISLGNRMLRKPWTILGRIKRYAEVVVYIKAETERLLAEGSFTEEEAQEIWAETTERILKLWKPPTVRAQATRSMNWYRAKKDPNSLRFKK